jgi:NADPH:quinone reductase-like Zn-dependent oxidoreductase
MKIGGTEVLKLEEVAAPKPSAGEVLVRNMRAGTMP